MGVKIYFDRGMGEDEIQEVARNINIPKVTISVVLPHVHYIQLSLSAESGWRISRGRFLWVVGAVIIQKLILYDVKADKFGGGSIPYLNRKLFNVNW